ncbi:acyl-CoA thioester hydrolase/BAAT C-terminal domain-containing protein [Pedobacter insulae]|uniref:BAAT / Acyl-CoA thioester hydrolase C terminal n=1 Tax=Pedobacter insulae TaxID=414048 RepID=A0A1I2X8F0_9SPHI|nr:acyl-CoA thioester hydrolase/BAAT C-terminal domain-containing protein [Pedobacter insulae]SFH09803.1 BAAT / Acyl-CoA thioester hydrolase C terminal [Pedobacter insulae]
MKNKINQLFFTILFISFTSIAQAQQIKSPGVNAQLFLGEGKRQPLIVGLGGSEGGNAWASDYWKKIRDQFIEKGYAFLAIGYFASEGAPDTLNKIELENVHAVIVKAQQNLLVNAQRTAIIGGSRGGDLALLLGSYYKDIKCVISVVGSHVAFPGHTNHFSTSAWSFKGKELPFVPVNEESVPALMKGDLRATFQTMLKDSLAEQRAIIKVEKINGPVFLLSATKDEICPSQQMADKMMQRLSAKQFSANYQHIAIEGGHAEPLKHFDLVFDFLEKNFPPL